MNPKSGWMDGELFHEWFVNHFLKYAPATRPLMLLLDGHASHYNPCFIREAASRGVIVFCLPPHTTHVCQPLDSNCFSILKKEWDKSCDLYMAQHPGKFVTIYQFSSVFAEAWQNAMISKIIRASFKATGVYPLNRKAVDIPGAVNEKPIVTPTEKLAKRKGIRYIPFYSSPCAEKDTKSPSPEESENSDNHPEDVQICRALFEECNVPEEDALGKTIIEEPKECNAPEENALGKTVIEEPKECSAPEEHALGKTVREEPKTLDDHDHSRCDNKDKSDGNISRLKEFLQIPVVPAVQLQNKVEKLENARVLTSSEFLKELEEKEKLKAEKEAQKQLRKQQREEKRAQKVGKRKKSATHGQDSTSEAHPSAAANNVTKVNDELTKCRKSSRNAKKTVKFKADVEEHFIDGSNESACSRNDCDHPRARSWVQCSCCDEWYHCVCEGAAYSDAKKNDYVFVCKNC